MNTDCAGDGECGALRDSATVAGCRCCAVTIDRTASGCARQNDDYQEGGLEGDRKARFLWAAVLAPQQFIRRLHVARGRTTKQGV
jgi:hypothetical protein